MICRYNTIILSHYLTRRDTDLMTLSQLHYPSILSPSPDGYRTSVRHFAKETFTLAPYCEQVMDTQAGECIASQFILVSHTHRNTQTHTPLGLLQTKEVPIDRWQGQTSERHYSQEIMPHTHTHTRPARLLAGWVKCWWRQRYEGECFVIRKAWW